MQYVDGLRGALVIHDPALQPAFASEPVVTLSDFYPEPWSVELSSYLSPSSEGDEPVPRNGVLNGVSQDSCLTAADYATCRYAYVKGTVGTCDRPNTRMRIINAGGQGIFNVSVDAHVMTVIAVDAVRVDPVAVGSIRINNGQVFFCFFVSFLWVCCVSMHDQPTLTTTKHKHNQKSATTCCCAALTARSTRRPSLSAPSCPTRHSPRRPSTT